MRQPEPLHNLTAPDINYTNPINNNNLIILALNSKASYYIVTIFASSKYTLVQNTETFFESVKRVQKPCESSSEGIELQNRKRSQEHQ